MTQALEVYAGQLLAGVMETLLSYLENLYSDDPSPEKSREGEEKLLEYVEAYYKLVDSYFEFGEEVGDTSVGEDHGNSD